MCGMNCVSHRGIAFILIGRSAIHQVCCFDVNLFDDLNTQLLKKAISSTSLVVQLKRQC